MDRIKIAYLDFSPHYAGAERALATIIANLDRTKFEPIIVFPYPLPHHKRYNELNCSMQYLCSKVKWWMGTERWSKPPRGTDFLKRTIFGHLLSEFLLKENIKILHVNLLRPDSTMWLMESHSKGIKIIGHFRSLPKEWIPGPNLQKCVDVLISVSNIVKANADTVYFHPNSIVIYDSVSSTRFNTKNAKSLNARPKIISSVAALFPNKGHDNAIIAFSKITTELPGYSLHIVGGGNKEELVRLEQLAYQYEVSDKVFFSKGQVDDVASVYRNSQLVLSLTKEGEAFGLVPYEAALCGTPVIAPNRGAITELLHDGQSSIFVDTTDVDAIAKKILWALNNLNECSNIVNETQVVIGNKLTPTVMTSKLMALYSELSKF